MIAVVSREAPMRRRPTSVGEESARAWGGTDPAVVTAAQSGCMRSFSSLYTRMNKRVRLAAVCILRDDHAADDTVQETFLAALEGLPGLADPRSFESWLMRIARNKAISAARRRDRMAPSSAVHRDDYELGSGGAAVVSRWGTEEPRPLTLLLLRTAYRDLPVHVARTMRLRYVAGLSCKQIAARLGVSVVCVKTRLHRGRSALYEAVRAGRE